MPHISADWHSLPVLASCSIMRDGWVAGCSVRLLERDHVLTRAWHNFAREFVHQIPHSVYENRQPDGVGSGQLNTEMTSWPTFNQSQPRTNWALTVPPYRARCNRLHWSVGPHGCHTRLPNDRQWGLQHQYQQMMMTTMMICRAWICISMLQRHANGYWRGETEMQNKTQAKKRKQDGQAICL